jgi:hypothetical protein
MGFSCLEQCVNRRDWLFIDQGVLGTEAKTFCVLFFVNQWCTRPRVALRGILNLSMAFSEESSPFLLYLILCESGSSGSKLGGMQRRNQVFEKANSSLPLPERHGSKRYQSQEYSRGS